MNPEFELMVNILRIEKCNLDFSLKIPEKINWEKWLELIQKHGVFSQIYVKIRKNRINIIPFEILNELKNLYLKNIANNLLICSELSKFQKLLSDEGIRALFFKGPVISTYAYNDYALRSYQDIDLIIDSKNFNKFYKYIKRNGFNILFKMGRALRYYWSFLGREYTVNKGRKIFDLHFRIQRGPEFFNLNKKLFEDVCEIGIENEKILCLSPEMSIIGICINATKDGWTRFVYIADFVNIVRNRSDISWKKVISISKKMKIYSLLLITLSLSETFLELEIPKEIDSKDFLNIRIKSLCDKFSDNVQEGYIKKKNFSYKSLEIKSIDTFWGRFRYYLYYIFVPKMSDIETVNIPGFLFPAFILLRPVFLLFRIGKLSGRGRGKK